MDTRSHRRDFQEGRNTARSEKTIFSNTLHPYMCERAAEQGVQMGQSAGKGQCSFPDCPFNVSDLFNNLVEDSRRFSNNQKFIEYLK